MASKRRSELRQRAIAYKGGKCQICGYDKSPAAFDFHHPDPREKEFSVSSRMTSWGAIVRELDKCVLLCSRCHREVHDGWHPSYLVHDDVNRGWVDGLDDALDRFDVEDSPEAILPGYVVPGPELASALIPAPIQPVPHELAVARAVDDDFRSPVE